MNDVRSVESWRMVSVWPRSPRMTSWWATSPGRRTEWMGTSPSMSSAVRLAVPEGASSLPSWWSSTISARARWREASAAKRIMRTAPMAKLGAKKRLASPTPRRASGSQPVVPATTWTPASRAAREAGVHVVAGTTGWDPEALRGVGEANLFFAPNFAIGAVLMMRFAAEASRHLARAEIVELHHDGKLDAPSGTAKRTAELMEGDVPIHSVRLPGLVAHQEVILGDVGQTLTIRHDSTDRTSFMPGVLLAVRKVGELTESPVVGLEHLLFAE